MSDLWAVVIFMLCVFVLMVIGEIILIVIEAVHKLRDDGGNNE